MGYEPNSSEVMWNPQAERWYTPNFPKWTVRKWMYNNHEIKAKATLNPDIENKKKTRTDTCNSQGCLTRLVSHPVIPLNIPLPPNTASYLICYGGVSVWLRKDQWTNSIFEIRSDKGQIVLIPVAWKLTGNAPEVSEMRILKMLEY